MHTDLMSLGQRIFKARTKKGLSQSALGKKLGVTREAVSQWEADVSEPTAARLRKLSVILDEGFDFLATGRSGEHGTVPGVRLWGEVAGGVWAEVRDSQDDDFQRVPVAPDPRYPASAQYALKVRGNSVNRVAKPGTVVICVDIVEANVELRDGDLVWVERRRGDLVETTLKRLRKGAGGAELWPESDDPKHQEKLAIDGLEGDAEVTIRGLVIYTLSAVPRGE
jgi:transcriptional regulator with XRE-family HTH domain